MTADVTGVFRGEAAALVHALRSLPPGEWERPTRCEPWSVRDLVGHLITVVGRTTGMIVAAGPDLAGGLAAVGAEVTANVYYRADERFSAQTHAGPVPAAGHRAALVPDVLVDELAGVCGTVAALSERQEPDLAVAIRRGEAMLLTEFLTTQVVELAVHGLDLADAVQCPAWLTPAAARHLLALLFGAGWPSPVAATGWGHETVIRRATGRAPATEAESALLDSLGLRRLTLG